VQYACREYIALLEQAYMKISMSRTGNPYDNAHMESFFKTLKYEEVHLSNYENFEDATQRLPHFIEEVYNNKRLHSALGTSPEEYEMESINQYCRSSSILAEKSPVEAQSTPFSIIKSSHSSRSQYASAISQLIPTGMARRPASPVFSIGRKTEWFKFPIRAILQPLEEPISFRRVHPICF
jgi:hypothetical protein